MTAPDTAVAVREDQHPIIAAIDAKMPEIAEILPAGMDDKRFRKVVVQAMLRTPALWECTPISIITAITEAAEVGIEPTGVLGKGWLIPYKGEAKFIPGWRGFVDLLWRADRILLTVDAVRIGDEFSYRRGTAAFLHHVPDLSDPEREATDDNITATYALASFPDGREDFEVMSRVALNRIRDVAVAKAKDPKKAIWNLHPGEMMKKTPIRRIAKRLPLSPAMQAILARDEEIDFDTPVERVADPKRDAIRERIASRTAAMRGELTEEPDPSVPTGGAEPEGQDQQSAPSQTGSATETPSGGSPAKGDPWMRRLHAVANERGMDHAALHDWAVEHFRVSSLSDLTTPQRATFMDLVERMPTLPSDGHPDSSGSEAATDQPDQGVADRSSVQAGQAGSPPSGSQPAPTLATPNVPGDARPRAGEGDGGQGRTPSAEALKAEQPDGSALTRPEPPTLDAILEATGGELVPPKPGTSEYKALPAGIERAKARAFWDAQKAPEPEQESLAHALGAPEAD